MQSIGSLGGELQKKLSRIDFCTPTASGGGCRVEHARVRQLDTFSIIRHLALYLQ